MRVAFVLFNQMTFLDFSGFYDVVTQIKTLGIHENFYWDCCALQEEICDDKNLIIKANKVGQPLDGYDLVFIPGGVGTRSLQYDDIFLSWIKSAKLATCKASVCTGSLVLGAAGFLKEKRATTHPKAYNELKPYCKSVSHQRIVDETNIITSGGASSSIDLGLYVCQKFYGKEAMQRIASSIDYLE